jgi:hypothetical protein
MRRGAFLCATVALILAPRVGILLGGADRKGEKDHIASLIRQLGHDHYQKREAASKQLEALGEPALAALRAAAASSDDAEIRLRSGRLVQTITERATRKQLAKFVGRWKWQQGNWEIALTLDAEGKGFLPLTLLKIPDLAFSSTPFAEVNLKVKGKDVFTDITLPTENTRLQLTLSRDEKTLIMEVVEGKWKQKIKLTRDTSR